VGLVLRGGLTLVLTGAALGIAASLALGRFVESFLYGVSGLDPIAALAAPLALGLIAMAATYLPARRASRVDPVQALRME
jgi:ABC-type antimicrobial peptide transport system permease subunit